VGESAVLASCLFFGLRDVYKQSHHIPGMRMRRRRSHCRTNLVFADDAHDALACDAEGALDATDLHRVDEHPRQAEGHLLGVLLALHGHLEAVPEVDVHHLQARGTRRPTRGGKGG